MADFVYDIETFPNIFSLGVVNTETNEIYYFEISWRQNDLDAMMEFFMFIATNNHTMVGFNNIGFDYPVLHHIIENRLHITVEAIFEKAMSIINTGWHNRFVNVIWEKDQHLKQIDLFKVHHFDNVAKSTSLKVLEFNMRMENVRDLPFPPGTLLTSEQMDTLKSYLMDDDIVSTHKFYDYSRPNLEFRRDLSLKYNRNLMSHNDTKIGKDYFINELERHTPGVCWDKSSGKRKPRQTKRPSIAFKDILLPYIRFTHPEFQRIHSWFYYNSIVNTKAEIGLNCTIDGFQFDFGTGGIHGSMSPGIVESDGQYMILDIDVEGYYPSLAIANNFFPAHLGEKFVEIYREIKLERKKHKKKTPENEMLKLAANGVYGDSNSVYSPMYDPQYTMAITVNGQLLLCMLAEKLMEEKSITMIQINTDGLTIKAPRRLYEWIRNLMTWWEGITGLTLEEAEYKRFFARDVNNYIGEFMDGKLKRIGAYAHETARENPSTREVQWHKDHSSLVVQKAAEANLVHNVDIRSFIEKHHDIYDYLLKAKVNRGSNLILVDYKGNKTIQQNTIRYYIAMFGDDLKKVMPPTPAQLRVNEEAPMREIGINTGYKVSVCNKMDEIFPEDIEFEWYIREARKLVDPILKGVRV